MPRHIPPEILAEIFSYLRLPRDNFEPWFWINYKTLAQLCLSCQGFRVLAEPLLYESIPAWLFSGGLERFACFVRTAVHNSRLAALVRVLECQDLDMLKAVADQFDGDQAADLVERLLGPDGRPEVRKHLEKLASRSADHLEWMFVMLFPRVRSWQCPATGNLLPDLAGVLETEMRANEAGPGVNEPRSVDLDQAAASEQQWLFPNLREVHVGYRDIWRQLRIVNCNGLLRPSVQKFIGFSIDWEMNPAKPLPTTQLALRSLNLFQAALLDVDGMRNILARCPGLERLRVTWGSPEFWDDWDWEGMEDVLPDYDGIGAALREHGEGLLELDLDHVVETCYGGHVPDPGPIGRIGSLRKLTKLKTLGIHVEALVGAGDNWEDDGDELQKDPTLDDVLPDSVELLRLPYCPGRLEADLDNQVHDLIGGGRMKALRHIDMFPHQRELRRDISTYGWDIERWGPECCNLPTANWYLILRKTASCLHELRRVQS